MGETYVSPKFALVSISSTLVIGSMNFEVKPRHSLRLCLRFPPMPLLPSTNASDTLSNAKFGLKLDILGLK